MNALELKNILKKYGWRNTDLANRLQVHKATVGKWVNGHTPISQIVSDRIMQIIEDENRKSPENMTIKERVLLVAHELDLSLTKFFSDLNMSYTAFKGKNTQTSVNSDFLVRLIKKHNVDPCWLLLGEGEIFKTNTQVHNKEESAASMKDVIKWMEQVIEKDKIIYDLRIELDKIKDDLADERIKNSRLESKLHDTDTRAAS